MPEPAYMTVTVGGTNVATGALTNDSVGTLSKPDREDFIIVQAFSHGVTKPTDVQSGQVMGQRQHLPFVVTKFIDKSTPELYQHLCKGTQIEEVKLVFQRTSVEGSEEEYYSITLKEATLVDMKTYIPNCLDPANKDLGHMEDLKFSYKEIAWRHEVCSTEGSDAWGGAKA